MVCLLVIPTVLNGQVRINEVLYNPTTGQVDQIELKNFGSAVVNVTDWWFCSLFIYDRVGNLNLISGTSFTIPAGGIIAVSGKSLNNTAADLALYLNGNNFSNPANMTDFVQWGSANHGREPEAVSRGFWPDNGFVPAVAAGHSIEYDGSGNGPSNWTDQPNPTIGQENVTSVDENPNVPVKFSLAQNYPNPFNPSTTIEFALPKSVHTTLKVFDLLGREVATLVDEQLPAGNYKREWHAQGMASGVYLYRLQAEEYVETKKLLFLR
jgi:hypothetical protein